MKFEVGLFLLSVGLVYHDGIVSIRLDLFIAIQVTVFRFYIITYLNNNTLGIY